MMMDGELAHRLHAWLPPNSEPDRPRMTLSTVTAEGMPDARTVLLTGFDQDGFSFHTDTRSRKVAQLAANPAVALTLVWDFERQLVVRGTAEVAPAAQTAAAYRTRSPYLQQLAWLNTFAFAQLSPDERRARWRAFAQSRPDGFTAPPTWTGYLVRPRRVTFWYGDPDATSVRLEYTATGDRWRVSRLPG